MNSARGIEKIVSGGQTGVDRGALDAALLLGVPAGGYCPRGRLSENGTIPKRYPLVETGSNDYAERTEKNVIHSDATLILSMEFPLRGGTLLTSHLAAKHRKPCRCFDMNRPPPRGEFRRWIEEERVRVLNIAGPRESRCPGIASKTLEYLTELLKPVK
jgi:hypothetical protein